MKRLVYPIFFSILVALFSLYLLNKDCSGSNSWILPVVLFVIFGSFIDLLNNRIVLLISCLTVFVCSVFTVIKQNFSVEILTCFLPILFLITANKFLNEKRIKFFYIFQIISALFVLFFFVRNINKDVFSALYFHNFNSNANINIYWITTVTVIVFSIYTLYKSEHMSGAKLSREKKALYYVFASLSAVVLFENVLLPLGLFEGLFSSNSFGLSVQFSSFTILPILIFVFDTLKCNGDFPHVPNFIKNNMKVDK